MKYVLILTVISYASTAVLNLCFVVKPTVRVLKQADGTTIILHNFPLNVPGCTYLTPTSMRCTNKKLTIITEE